MQSHQIVLHLLKGGQYSLAIVGNVPVVAGERCLSRRFAPACIEECLREASSDSPETARPIKPVQQKSTLPTCQGGDGESRIVSCFCDSDLLVCCGHAAFRHSDIRTAFEQLRRERHRNGREYGRVRPERRDGKAEFRW